MVELSLSTKESEVYNEIHHNLYEWGVNRQDNEHGRFRKKVIKEAISNLSKEFDEPLDYSMLKKEKFPKNYNDAYEHVLRKDEVPANVHNYIDRLDIDAYPEPYHRRRDRITHKVVYSPGDIRGYVLKREYKQFKSEQFDPLNRYSFVGTTEEEIFFERWFVDDDVASSQGLLLEAVLACHALQFEACYNCKYRKTLRWNGGGSSSWQDIVCTECGAVYEVKTKADAEKVENVFKYNNIQGGSFSAWCQLSNSKKRSQKLYLVIVPRKPTLNRKRETVYPVTIVEIDDVLPKLVQGSFNPNQKYVSFKSKVSLKLHTKAKWFDLPTTGEVIEMEEIAKRVFKDRFTVDTYNKFMDLYFGSDSSDEKEKEVEEAVHDEAVTVKATNDIKDITDEFKQLEVVDDWEDLASDSE